MRGLKYHGYQELTVEVRAMTFSELCLYMIDVFEKNHNYKIKVVDVVSGEMMCFDSIRSILECSWSKSFKLEVINMPHTYDDTAVIVIQSLDDGFRLI